MVERVSGRKETVALGENSDVEDDCTGRPRIGCMLASAALTPTRRCAVRCRRKKRRAEAGGVLLSPVKGLSRERAAGERR
jgi:hypothetical protein